MKLGRFGTLGCWALALVLLVWGSGCTSVTLTANKDAAASLKVKRLYLLVNNGEVGKQKFSEPFVESFRQSLSNAPVTLESAVLTPLDLDERACGARIEHFGPDAVLVVRINTYVVDEFGGYPTLVYDASLYEPTLKRRLWRANINNSGSTSFMQRRMKEMAEVLVKRLKTDGFLPDENKQ